MPFLVWHKSKLYFAFAHALLSWCFSLLYRQHLSGCVGIFSILGEKTPH